MRRVLFALALLGCGRGGESVEPTLQQPTSEEAQPANADRDHAIAVARALAVSQGSDLSEAQLESAVLVDGHWIVTYVHPPPTPPGGFFSVSVDPTTWQGVLMPGE